MIDVKNVSFSYGDKKVLSDIKAQFKVGESAFIIGANGSGKSTLLSLIARLLTPNQGTISIDGENYKDLSSKEFAKKVSIMIQQRKIPDISVREFVSYGRYPYLSFSHSFSAEDERIVEDALLKTNTKEFAQTPLSCLSGGERQRVYIAMLLAQNTPYILLDEPTTFLDIQHSIEMMEILNELKKDGKGIIAVVHDVRAAFKYADRILILKDGKLILDSSADTAYESSELTDALGITLKKVFIDGETEYFPVNIKKKRVASPISRPD